MLWNEECTNYVIDAYVNKRMSIAKIAAEMNTTQTSISKELKRNNVHIRTDRASVEIYS